MAGATSDRAWDIVQWFLGTPIGILCLFGWTLSLVYHLCSGIRHLLWDAGRGFELRTAYASGWTVVIVTAALSLIAWIAAYASRGGGM